MEALILILLVLLIILFLRYRKSSKLNKDLEKEANRLKTELISEQRKFEDYKQATEYLKKFEKIRDAEIEKDRIIEEASQILDKANQTSEKIINEAKDKANEINQEAEEVLKDAKKSALETGRTAREKAKQTNQKAENSLIQARKLARHIEEEAKHKAREIAGEAWEVKEKAAHSEKTVKAMKNLIKGYGDEYLIPNQSLLDDLAEEYSHKQAGAELTEVRKLIKTLIKNQEVAECDYVEASRRAYAIAFVIDAFNGKVDTIMSRVKHDNYGKLHQSLKDAYILVNNNGKAFRNARIREDYFTLVERQLKLAVTVQELKRLDREEQKRIREEMREEERARREYEKALKEAAKEEKMLAKAMKLAEAKLSSAAAEERAKFEQELESIKEKLALAEEKGQRALSMAQQTKRGHVYIISNVGSFGENVLKIGLTRRLDPMDRVKELGDASVPFQFDVHAMIHSENAPELEKKLHEIFSLKRVNKVNHRKEFFNVSISEVKAKFEELELETHWTMKAEALEYRESLEIAKKELLLMPINEN